MPDPGGIPPAPHTPPSGLALHPLLADEDPGSSAARLAGLSAPRRGPRLSSWVPLGAKLGNSSRPEDLPLNLVSR